MEDPPALLEPRRQSQVGGVEGQVVGHEGGYEVVGVVVARLHPQGDGDVGGARGRGRSGRGEVARLQLLLEEPVGGAL